MIADPAYPRIRPAVPEGPRIQLLQQSLLMRFFKISWTEDSSIPGCLFVRTRNLAPQAISLSHGFRHRGSEAVPDRNSAPAHRLEDIRLSLSKTGLRMPPSICRTSLEPRSCAIRFGSGRQRRQPAFGLKRKERAICSLDAVLDRHARIVRHVGSKGSVI